MKREDVDSRLADVLATVLGVDADMMTDEVSPQTVGAWTSIVHLSLIAAVEEAFSVHFSVNDIYGATSVGALRRIVLAHLDRGGR